MKDEKDDKLGKLFKEKFQNDEIFPEEDYWPEIEKALHGPSFTQFGWKHINIYNTSFVAMLLFACFYLFYSSDKGDIRDEERPIKNEQPYSDTPQEVTSQSGIKTEKSDKKTKGSLADKTIENVPLINAVNDSVGVHFESKEDVVPVIDSVEKPKVKKPKEVIYIIQQDTIVERDTVKVRRLKRK